MRFFAVVLIFYGVTASLAQTPEVPHKMHFADMTLTIRDDARREIQKDVDALTRSPKYFGIKVERARTYFPFIEKVFAEERLPDDFKYLALQESALISDAVSTSNAVGFWQFKDFTAMEMGMRVDKQIDERMNIVSASRGAARYLKQNNFMFNNWLYALQAYQMGAGGVKRVVGDEHNGAKRMEITSDTYWYVKKFLAHKVAFENAVKGEPQIKVQAYTLKEKKELSELATQLGIEESYLKENNKWIRTSTIPDDRAYTVLVPGGKLSAEFNTLMVSTPTAIPDRSPSNSDKTVKKEINGVMAIQALSNERLVTLAERAGLSISELLKFNDIAIDHSVRRDEFYFIAKKKNKSAVATHTLSEGEDLWQVSQRYGVVLKRLKKLNRLSADVDLNPGEVIWLSARKPAGQPTEQIAEVAITQGVESEFFDWEVNPGEPVVITRVEPADIKGELKETKVSTYEANVVNATARPGSHVVVPGETLYSIAKLYSVAVTELLEWNQLDITRGIKPGQELSTTNPSAVPASQPEAQPTKTKGEEWVMYEAKTSDTLYSVARQYNVTIKEIMDWNNKADFSLAQGEKIRILAK